MNKKTKDWIKKMNKLGMQRIPFFFMIDFEMLSVEVIPLSELSDDYSIQLENFQFNTTKKSFPTNSLTFEKYPISLKKYAQGFDIVKNNLAYGNSFLTNYTAATPVVCNYNLEEIFTVSEAKYKLLVKDRFTVFSPETFVKMEQGYIHAFPMKGTIDASIDKAEEKILADQKELAEHYTIVDLIRNDLSRVSKEVSVPKFRYVERIGSNDKDLLQVSSQVSGKLEADYLDKLGDLFFELLPAGSISGAPKNSTLTIIKTAEKYNRGMYTGVFGIFDGVNVDSGVAIRFIENCKGKLQYRSGGGITHQSDVATEYQEMLDKVYVPINRKYQNLQRQSVQHKVAQCKV